MNSDCQLSLAIDATNIRSGGGLTHLVQVLRACSLDESGFDSVTVFACRKTADHLPSRGWIKIYSAPWMEGALLWRLLCQQFRLPRLVKRAGCDLLFSPGGTLPAMCSIPMVTMSQNMLPFESDRAALFGRWSWMLLKMRLLRLLQARSFKAAKGVIFLSQYALNSVTASLGGLKGVTAIIPHGVEHRFRNPPRSMLSEKMRQNESLRLLYVSIQAPYKHHLELIKAVASLRSDGRMLTLQMVGPHTYPYSNDVQRLRLSLDPDEVYLHDSGHVRFDLIHKYYEDADLFIFASSCENLPNILIEGMSSGLPIACADRGPMPEVLRDGGVYFDPESPASIAKAISFLVDNPEIRRRLAHRSWELSQLYTWRKCGHQTLDFLARIAQQQSI